MRNLLYPMQYESQSQTLDIKLRIDGVFILLGNTTNTLILDNP